MGSRSPGNEGRAKHQDAQVTAKLVTHHGCKEESPKDMEGELPRTVAIVVAGKTGRSVVDNDAERYLDKLLSSTANPAKELQNH